jgi:hypothetical protein
MSLQLAVSCIYKVFVKHVDVIQWWYQDMIFETNVEHELEQRVVFVLSCKASYQPPLGLSEIQLLRHLRNLSTLTRVAAELADHISDRIPFGNFSVSIDDIKNAKSLPVLDLADLGNDHLLRELD